MRWLGVRVPSPALSSLPGSGAVQDGPRQATSKRARTGCSSAVADAGGGVEGCPSGQREQTVNLPAYAFEGSNPSPSTIPDRPQDLSGNSSAARASAFQAEGRGFESRFPLQIDWPRGGRDLGSAPRTPKT
jgi:hypothetical protein